MSPWWWLLWSVGALVVLTLLLVVVAWFVEDVRKPRSCPRCDDEGDYRRRWN